MKAIIRCTDQLHDGSSHVSYRDSKLTRLMAGALGGRAHGLLVGCISGAAKEYNETLAMLTYLDKCRQVRTTPTPNVVNRQAEVAKVEPRIIELAQQLLGKSPAEVKSMKPSDVQVSCRIRIKA